MEGSRGLSGEMTCVTVTLKDSTARHYILKMTRDGTASRRSVIRGGGATREARFYRSELAAKAGAHPDAVYVRASSLLAEAVILMVDIPRTYGAVNVNFVFGNQIWGVPAPLSPPRDPAVVLRAMFLWAADLHAPTWCDRSLIPKDWLKGAAWFRGEQRARWESAIDIARSAWTKIKSRMASGSGGVQWSPRIVSLLDASFEAASWTAMQAMLNDPSRRFALCHGDFHASNAFLLDDGSISMFDWSEVGPWEPTTDLAQFIISDVRPEVFRAHVKDALAAYVARLKERGVQDETYTVQVCEDAFARGAERWVWLLPVLADFPGMPDIATQYFHDQVAAFVDHFLPDVEMLQLKSVVCL